MANVVSDTRVSKTLLQESFVQEAEFDAYQAQFLDATTVDTLNEWYQYFHMLLPKKDEEEQPEDGPMVQKRPKRASKYVITCLCKTTFGNIGLIARWISGPSKPMYACHAQKHLSRNAVCIRNSFSQPKYRAVSEPCGA